MARPQMRHSSHRNPLSIGEDKLAGAALTESNNTVIPISAAFQA